MGVHKVLTPLPSESIDWFGYLTPTDPVKYDTCPLSALGSTSVRKAAFVLMTVPLVTWLVLVHGRSAQGEPAPGQDFWTGLLSLGCHGPLLHLLHLFVFSWAELYKAVSLDSKATSPARIPVTPPKTPFS